MLERNIPHEEIRREMYTRLGEIQAQKDRELLEAQKKEAEKEKAEKAESEVQ